MSVQDRDNTLKALDRMAGVTRDAALAVTSLEDKVRFQRLHKSLNECRNKVRLAYYEYEDALEVMVEHCPDCGSVDTFASGQEPVPDSRESLVSLLRELLQVTRQDCDIPPTIINLVECAIERGQHGDSA